MDSDTLFIYVFPVAKIPRTLHVGCPVLAVVQAVTTCHHCCAWKKSLKITKEYGSTGVCFFEIPVLSHPSPMCSLTYTVTYHYIQWYNIVYHCIPLSCTILYTSVYQYLLMISPFIPSPVHIFHTTEA